MCSACAPCRRQLVLVDRGILRPGDSFVSGMLWGFVRSIYDEEGCELLEQAGQCATVRGMQATVIVYLFASPVFNF